MRILLINTAHLGDVISSTIVSEAFFTAETSVDFLIPPSFFALFSDDPRYQLVTIEQAQKKQYDLIVDLDSSSKSRKIVKTLTATQKIGRFANIFRKLKYSFIYTHQVNKWPYTHVVKDYLPILELLNLPVSLQPAIHRLPKADLEKQLQSLRNKYSKIIVAHFGSASYLRQIPAHLARELMRKWLDQNYFVFLVGTEKEIIDPLAAMYSEHSEHFQGDLGTIADLINLCDFTFGADSGIIHIAGALQKPGLTLNGPTLSSATKPISNKIVAYELDYPCRPCNQNRTCRFDRRCLKQMTSDSILQLVNKGVL